MLLVGVGLAHGQIDVQQSGVAQFTVRLSSGDPVRRLHFASALPIGSRLAVGNGDGPMDAVNDAIWRQRLSQLGGGVHATVAITEPAAAAMLLFALGAGMVWRRG